MRILVCHPGHSFSTIDVYDGLCAGLELAGATVIPFDWERPLRVLGTILSGAIASGTVAPDKAEHFRSFTSWLAAADAISVAVDQEVDAVIVVNGTLFPLSRARLLQKLNIPVACFGTEAPYFLRLEQELSRHYTHWFTNEKKCVDAFGDTPTFYLPHAYNPNVHVPAPIEEEKRCDVVFVGGGYPERKKLLEGVDWGGAILKTLGTLWHLDLTAELGSNDAARASRYSEKAIPNTETTAWHRAATISLNLHRKMMQVETGREIAPGSASSLGPRAYEIPACGGFMLIDDERPEATEVFGDSLASFRAWDSASLEREIRYWLTHPDARDRARTAQREAVLPHSWTARARYVLECITA